MICFGCSRLITVTLNSVWICATSSTLFVGEQVCIALWLTSTGFLSTGSMSNWRKLSEDSTGSAVLVYVNGKDILKRERSRVDEGFSTGAIGISGSKSKISHENSPRNRN